MKSGNWEIKVAYHFLCFALLLFCLFCLFCFVYFVLFAVVWGFFEAWRCSGGVLVRPVRPECLDIRKRDTGGDSRPDPARLQPGCRPSGAGTRQSQFHRCQSVANPDFCWCTDWTSIRISILSYNMLLYCTVYSMCCYYSYN